MYSYSPIKKIYIKNFRNIGEATIDFEDSPIVSLIGENEQGKTQVVKAIAVCAMHATPRDQKDYIRDGTKGFGVAIELQDGTQVVRMRMATVNSYRVTYPVDNDGNPTKPTWEAQKIGADLPVAVQEVMGMIEEPETKEFLHIRTYEDQLLFVTTASSTNYKVMYNALKISQLVDAIKLGSKEANALKTSINQKEISQETLEKQQNQLRVYDLEPVQNIRKRLKNQVEQIRKIERALEIRKKLKQMEDEAGHLRELAVLGEVSVNEAYTLYKIQGTLESVHKLRNMRDRLSIVETLPSIDIQQLNKMSTAVARKQTIDKDVAQSSLFIEVSKLPEISIQEVQNLQRAVNINRTIKNQTAGLNKIDTSGAEYVQTQELEMFNRAQRALAIKIKNEQSKRAVAEANKYCDAIVKWFKDIGVDTETCPKCGETIVIDIDKFKA